MTGRHTFWATLFSSEFPLPHSTFGILLGLRHCSHIFDTGNIFSDTENILFVWHSSVTIWLEYHFFWWWIFFIWHRIWKSAIGILHYTHEYFVLTQYLIFWHCLLNYDTVYFIIHRYIQIWHRNIFFCLWFRLYFDTALNANQFITSRISPRTTRPQTYSFGVGIFQFQSPYPIN